MAFTFQDLTTAAGAAAVAVFAMTLVQVLKAGLPSIFTNLTGATFAFLITFAVYAIGAAVLTSAHTIVDANGYLALTIAWVACATITLGIHSVANGGAATFVRGAPVDAPHNIEPDASAAVNEIPS